MRRKPATWILVVILALIAALFVARALRQPARLRGAATAPLVMKIDIEGAEYSFLMAPGSVLSHIDQLDCQAPAAGTISTRSARSGPAL